MYNMVKGKGTYSNGLPFILLGLSRKNTELLLEGKPIIVKAADVALTHDIILVGGETEGDIVKELNETAEQTLDIHSAFAVAHTTIEPSAYRLAEKIGTDQYGLRAKYRIRVSIGHDAPEGWEMLPLDDLRYYKPDGTLQPKYMSLWRYPQNAEQINRAYGNPPAPAEV